MQKKASLHLSIQAIVIIVLAMTLLGLGLAFIRGQFRQFTETSIMVQQQIKEQILDDLRTGNKKLSVPGWSITVGYGKSKDIAVGVANRLDKPINFCIYIEPIKAIIRGEETTEDLGEKISFFYTKGPYTLGIEEGNAFGVRIRSIGEKGLYLIKVSVMYKKEEIIGDCPATSSEAADGYEEYASRTFNIDVV